MVQFYRWFNFCFLYYKLPYQKTKERNWTKDKIEPQHTVYVVVNFLCQAIFDFLLFLGMLLYANEVETKEK